MIDDVKKLVEMAVLALILVIVLNLLFSEDSPELQDSGKSELVQAFVDDTTEVYETEIKAESADLRLQFYRYRNKTGIFDYEITPKSRLRKEFGIGVLNNSMPAFFLGVEYAKIGLKSFAGVDADGRASAGIFATYKF